MRRLSWAVLMLGLASNIWAAPGTTVRSDRFSENPLRLKVPGQEATENAEATADAQAAQKALLSSSTNTEEGTSSPELAQEAGGTAPASSGATEAVVDSMSSSEQEPSLSALPETAPMITEEDATGEAEPEMTASHLAEGQKLEQALDAEPTVNLPPLEPTLAPAISPAAGAVAAGSVGSRASDAAAVAVNGQAAVSAEQVANGDASSDTRPTNNEPPSSSSSSDSSSSSSSPSSSSSSSDSSPSSSSSPSASVREAGEQLSSNVGEGESTSGEAMTGEAAATNSLPEQLAAPAALTVAEEAMDEFDRGVAQYKKTPDYIKSAMLEKSRFMFMSGNDNFLHGGFVALFGEKHASSGDDFGRTLSLETHYYYQAPYAEWHFILETVGITQHKRNIWGEPCYRDGKPMQYFLERDRAVIDIRRKHQYGTVYWLGGLLLEYWTDRGFLAKPIQKRWHKTFEQQGAVQYYNLDRGIDQTAFGMRSGLGVKELWNTAAYWDNMLQVEMVLEQMFSYKRRGSIGWTGEYTMTTGTWLNRNLSNPALSLQFWGTYRRLFGGADESQGGVNLIYGFAGQEKEVWRVLLGVNFNREWEDRYFGKYDKDHAFWYLGVDVLTFE